jgi:hypothetical protein
MVLIFPLMQKAGGAAANHSTVPKGMIIALAFQLLPLLFSARAMVTELPFMDSYRLSACDPIFLLRAKLRIHIAIQLSLALLFGAISLIAGGSRHAIHDALFLVLAIMVYVPPLTCLAIALGVIFPDRSGVRSFFSLDIKGSIAYGITYALTYAFTWQSYEFFMKSQPGLALLAFSAGTLPALTGPIALLSARNRLIHFTTRVHSL